MAVTRGFVKAGLIVLALSLAIACGKTEETQPGTAAASITPPPEGAPIPATTSPFDALPDNMQQRLDEPFTGDLDALIKRRVIRVAVTFNRTHYFIDRGEERGIAFEALKSFEDDLNTRLKTRNLKVHVVMMPMSREQLAPALTSGKVDMIAAMVTVTPEREKRSPSRSRRVPASTRSWSPARRPDHRDARGSLRPGSVRPQGQHL